MKHDTLTYSALSTFQTCRRKYQLRYINGLVPIEKARPLGFGTTAHEWLKVWHESRSLEAARAVIDRAYLDREADADRKSDWHYQIAMLRAYAEKYPAEEFEVIALEREFAGPLVNPDTNKPSRSFRIRGKADGVVRKGDEYSLIEHKTIGTLTGDYMERVTLDAQIAIYCLYLNRELGAPLHSVIYNLLQKSRLSQSQGESEAEFQVRAAELASRNKSGKSSAQRREPESDAAFQARLGSWYAGEPRFVRMELLLDYDRIQNIQRQIWDIGQEILWARRKELFHQNTRACFGFGRCEYWPICSSGSNTNVIDNFYRTEAPHAELESAEISEGAAF